jgi:hypothetical protein
MKQLITDVLTRLADTGKLQYIDSDNGQLDVPQPPVKYPCALVDITGSQPSDAGGGRQVNIVTLQVRVADLVLSPGSMGAAPAQKERALGVFDLIDAINARLHGWHGSPHYGLLTKSGFRKVHRQDGLREFAVMYRVQVTDTSAVAEPVTAKVNTVKILV